MERDSQLYLKLILIYLISGKEYLVILGSVGRDGSCDTFHLIKVAQVTISQLYGLKLSIIEAVKRDCVGWGL